MSNSILDSTKKVLGISEDYTVFDADVTMHINSALATLVQMGVGPANGFMIEDKAALWTDFLGLDPNFNPAKTLVYLRVRLAFDPPATSYHILAIEKQIEEITWRLNTYRESLMWTDPTPLRMGSNPFADRIVLDGGTT